MIEVKAKGLAQAGKNTKAVSGNIKKSQSAYIEWATRLIEREVKILMSGRLLKVRTGKTRASVTAEIDKNKNLGRVGTKHPGSRLLEVGGTIRPKKAKFLTIPLPGEASTGAGMVRRAKDYYGVFPLRTSKGMILMGSRTPNRPAAPIFILRKSATIKAHPVWKTAQQTTEPAILKRGNAIVQSSIDREMRD